MELPGRPELSPLALLVSSLMISHKSLPHFPFSSSSVTWKKITVFLFLCVCVYGHVFESQKLASGVLSCSPLPFEMESFTNLRAHRFGQALTLLPGAGITRTMLNLDGLHVCLG